MIGRAAALAGAIVAVLAGCTTPVPPPPPASDADVEAFVARQLDEQWESLALDVARPVVQRERFITTVEWGDVMSGCMAGEGVPGYDQGNFDESETQLSPAEVNLAWYRCIARFPTDPHEYAVFSEKQIAFIYDYYRRWTLPCLASLGYVATLPSRADFLAYNGYWNPIYSEYSMAQEVDDDTYRELDARCGIDVLSKLDTE